MKSVLIPIFSARFFSSSPVNPATKPKAVFSTPRLERTCDTLMPFPPGNTHSSVVLFTFPISNLLTDTI